jgi:hypothetical protein
MTLSTDVIAHVRHAERRHKDVMEGIPVCALRLGVSPRAFSMRSLNGAAFADTLVMTPVWPRLAGQPCVHPVEFRRTGSVHAATATRRSARGAGA